MTSARLTKEKELMVKLDPAFQEALSADPRAEWEHKSLCKKFPLEMFYPIGYTRPEDKKQAADAVSICHQCPVRANCLRETLVLDDRYGVRGGYDEPTRKFYHQVYEKYYRTEDKPPSIATLLSGLIQKSA